MCIYMYSVLRNTSKKMLWFNMFRHRYVCQWWCFLWVKKLIVLWYLEIWHNTSRWHDMAWYGMIEDKLIIINKCFKFGKVKCLGSINLVVTMGMMVKDSTWHEPVQADRKHSDGKSQVSIKRHVGTLSIELHNFSGISAVWWIIEAFIGLQRFPG